MKIPKSTLGYCPSTSIQINTIDASSSTNGDFETADLIIAMHLNGEFPEQFKDDCIEVRLNIFNSGKREDLERISLNMSFGDAYSLYKAIGFFLDEYRVLKKDSNK